MARSQESYITALALHAPCRIISVEHSGNGVGPLTLRRPLRSNTRLVGAPNVSDALDVAAHLTQVIRIPCGSLKTTQAPIRESRNVLAEHLIFQGVALLRREQAVVIKKAYQMAAGKEFRTQFVGTICLCDALDALSDILSFHLWIYSVLGLFQFFEECFYRDAAVGTEEFPFLLILIPCDFL